MPEQIQPFQCEVPEEVLNDLKSRLANTRYPDQLDGAQWDYGSELTYVRSLCDYWRD